MRKNWTVIKKKTNKTRSTTFVIFAIFQVQSQLVVILFLFQHNIERFPDFVIFSIALGVFFVTASVSLQLGLSLLLLSSFNLRSTRWDDLQNECPYNFVIFFHCFFCSLVQPNTNIQQWDTCFDHRYKATACTSVNFI